MKKQFYKAAKELRIKIKDYLTYRSDMGFQVYNITYFFDGLIESKIDPMPMTPIFSDSYPIGECDGQKKVIDQFIIEIKNHKNKLGIAN